MANAITFARIGLVLPFIWFFLINAAWGVKAAFVVFALAAATDFIDGRVARARGETSTLGAALDPLADKLLIAAALILLLRNGVVYGAGVIAVLIIVLRELLITGLREALAKAGQDLPVTGLAKYKTASQVVAAGLLLLAAPTGFIGEALRPLAIGVLWFASALTLWTGVDYALKSVRILRTSPDGR
ncbi:MAG: CDP-diacylglycerol--glycerol-3-phosphate 3-phosphatidyltransferase [Pseudomonadota bacterium]